MHPGAVTGDEGAGAKPTAAEADVAVLAGSLRSACAEFREAVQKDDRAAVPLQEALSSECGKQLKFQSSRALKRVLEAKSQARAKLKRCGADKDVSTARLQETVKKMEAVVRDLKANVKTKLDDMWETMENYPEENCHEGFAPTAENVEAIVTFAHKLCYTTFAPPGFRSGDPLRLFRPPAPQEQQFRNACLYEFAEKRAKMEPLLKQSGVGLGASPMFEPPAGWKPGDPIPGQSRAEDSKESEEEASSSGVSSGDEDEGATQDEGAGAGFDFILNPDLEVVDEESSSDEYSSDES